MIKTLLLPFWLALLAVSSGLPVARHASSHAYALDAPPPQASEAYPPPNLRFDCLSAADGLSFSLATSVVQDQQGYMWFGTRYGLDKYDGNDFTVYLPGSRSDPMGGNYIVELYHDRTGDLWMGTTIDLVRRDGKTGKFIHYTSDPNNPNSLAPGHVNAIREDSAGTIWIGTNGGLSRYNPSTQTFTRYLQDQAVLRIYPDREGGIWLGTASGLWYYGSGSLEQQNPVQYRNDPADPTSLSSDIVIAIHQDTQGAVWVGTQYGGLNRLDRASGRFTHYSHDPDAPYSLSDDSVYAILEDESGRLWVGTQNGLNLLDRATGRFSQYHYDPGDPHSLSNDVVNDLYQDRAGVVWIATLDGICKVNETASRFTFYRQGLSDNLITSVYQGRNGILWVGTALGGLNRLDRNTGRVTVYRHDPADSTSISWGEVTAIYEDRAGTLWIGTSDGVDRFNPQTGIFESEKALQGLLIGSIVEDQQGNLWAGTWNGVMRRRPGASAFAAVSLAGDPPVKHRVQRLYVDRTGALWISTQNDGLFRLDPALEGGSTPAVIHFPQDSGDSNSPGTSPVMSFYEDGNGALWMGSVEDGLVRFDRDTLTFRHFMPDTGIAKYVSCIEGDAQGLLWMGTVLGLARFDPHSEAFSYFDARDGLVVGEGISCSQGKQGEMFFGSWSGLVTFFPDQIRDNPHPPAVVITALNLRNQALRTDLAPDEQIKLSYRENYLSFDFAALDYAAPAKNQYAYKMEGLDTDWVESGTRRHADYPDLRPGMYTFRVKASNNSGAWNEQGAAVQITITPPFWQTWWFLGLLGVTLMGVIAGGVRLRLKSIEVRSRELEAQVASRTRELVALNELAASQVAQLTALQETAKAVTSTLELDSLLNLIIQQATTLLHADGGLFNLVDRDQKVDEVVAVTGLAPSVIGARTALEGSLSGWATLHNQAIISNQIPDDDRVARRDRSWVVEEHIQSAAVAPLTIKDKVTGTLVVVGRKEGKGSFGQADLDLLVAFANQAAIAIENARLYEQSKELAVVEERNRLARELHDAVTQTLFSASLVAEALPATWEKSPQEGRGLLQELRGLSRGALAEMRTLLLELRPAALMETRLEDLLRQLGEAASGRAGIAVTVQVEGQAPAAMPPLPPDVQIALYRITQEALNNVVKHARARQVTVRQSYPGEDQTADAQAAGRADSGPTRRVLLSIRDDGRGFDPARVPHSRLGLGIMQERAEAIGATLTVESQPGHGAQVTVLWEQADEEETR